jgi:hypothetical protein
LGASRESVLTAQSLNDTALIIRVLPAARGRQESGLARLLPAVVRPPFGRFNRKCFNRTISQQHGIDYPCLAAARGQQESGLARLLCAVVRSPFGASRESVLTAQSLNNTALIIRVWPPPAANRKAV